MTKVRVVTGYVPIPKHPRTSEEYGVLGEKLTQLNVSVHPFYNKVEDCWLYNYLRDCPLKVTHSKGDNPDKNTLAYHVVNHQKIAWMRDAAEFAPDIDTFVWLDYGICRLPGVTPEVINEFLAKIKENDLAIPGCWDRTADVTDLFPSWRFCGSMLVVPRKYVQKLDKQIRSEIISHITKTRNVWWEVNTWAAVEKHSLLPIRWYKADHNRSMFDNYGETNVNALV